MHKVKSIMFIPTGDYIYIYIYINNKTRAEVAANHRTIHVALYNLTLIHVYCTHFEDARNTITNTF